MMTNFDVLTACMLCMTGWTTARVDVLTVCICLYLANWIKVVLMRWQVVPLNLTSRVSVDVLTVRTFIPGQVDNGICPAWCWQLKCLYLSSWLMVHANILHVCIRPVLCVLRCWQSIWLYLGSGIMVCVEVLTLCMYLHLARGIILDVWTDGVYWRPISIVSGQGDNGVY